MKNWKKWSGAALALVMAWSLAACGTVEKIGLNSRLESVAESVGQALESVSESASNTAESVAESLEARASEAVESASVEMESAAESLAAHASEAAESAASKASEAAESAAAKASEAAENAAAKASEAAESISESAAVETAAETAAEDKAEKEAVEKNGDVYILYTSDIHCGIDQGFGLEGLQQVRDSLEAQGYTTLLVDDGDAVQGEAIGTLTKGTAIVDLMNKMHYDVAIPGNHEFDYGVEHFLELSRQAEYPYISCNFTHNDELVLPPYVIKEAAGMRIAFVGVTTPETVTTHAARYFQDENGEYIYGFMQDSTGELLYEAVQKAVDEARAEGADYVYLMGHLGLEAEVQPWTYADVISHTNGIDVVLDGHSHDAEQIVMNNKDGEPVVRTACGTKLRNIGYSHISAKDGIVETNLWTWPNRMSAPKLLNLNNAISAPLREAKAGVQELLEKKVAATAVDLTIYDPVATDSQGNPIRMVRRAETNMGDLCTDAIREASGADVAIINGGGIRSGIKAGDITYGDIIKVFPFSNEICVVEVTGQQILDALEWGARVLPGENGSFMQVSGLSYEADATIESGCRKDENGFMTGIEGEYRVRNVMIGEEPLDPEKTYTLASTTFVLKDQGDGLTAFDNAAIVQDEVKLDNQLLIDFITETLGGVIGEEYEDPYGQGRITIHGD